MKTLRKTLAVTGLLGLGVIAYRLAAGAIDLVAAAQRAAALMIALMVLQWLVRLVVSAYARSLEGHAADQARRSIEQIELRRD